MSDLQDNLHLRNADLTRQLVMKIHDLQSMIRIGMQHPKFPSIATGARDMVIAGLNTIQENLNILKGGYDAFEDVHIAEYSQNVLNVCERLPESWAVAVSSTYVNSDGSYQPPSREGLSNINDSNIARFLKSMSMALHSSEKTLNDLLRSSGETLEEQKEALTNLKSSFEETILKYKLSEPDLDDIVGKSRKAALASSFNERAKASGRTRIFWGIVLAIALVALAGNGVHLLYLQTKSWEHLLIGFIISGPLVWMGWFAAKQFGYSSRIQEDYLFKVAIATSYEAYKKEMGETSPEILQKLMNSTVSTFSENPIRIYSGPSDPGTPAQELLEGLGKQSAVIEALTKKLPSH